MLNLKDELVRSRGFEMSWTRSQPFNILTRSNDTMTTGLGVNLLGPREDRCILNTPRSAGEGTEASNISNNNLSIFFTLSYYIPNVFHPRSASHPRREPVPRSFTPTSPRRYIPNHTNHRRRCHRSHHRLGSS